MSAGDGGRTVTGERRRIGRRLGGCPVWQVFKSTSRKVAEFSVGRVPQPDGEFLADCGLDRSGDRADVALAVRRVVAKLGKVDPSMIRAADRWPDDLGVLPFWDSIDWLHFVLSVELELERQILGGLEDLITVRPVTVADLARRVFESAGRRLNAAPRWPPLG